MHVIKGNRITRCLNKTPSAKKSARHSFVNNTLNHQLLHITYLIKRTIIESIHFHYGKHYFNNTKVT